MKFFTLFALMLGMQSNAFAQLHPYDPLPPKCSDPFQITLESPNGFNGFCCSTSVHFIVAPEMTCPSGYTFVAKKPKPKGSTYYYCCQMNNPNTGTGTGTAIKNNLKKVKN